MLNCHAPRNGECHARKRSGCHVQERGLPYLRQNTRIGSAKPAMYRTDPDRSNLVALQEIYYRPGEAELTSRLPKQFIPLPE